MYGGTAPKILAAMEAKVEREGLLKIGFEATRHGNVYFAEKMEKLNAIEDPTLAARYSGGVWRTVWAARNAMKEMYFAPSTSRRQRVLAALKDAKEWMELKEENGLPY